MGSKFLVLILWFSRQGSHKKGKLPDLATLLNTFSGLGSTLHVYYLGRIRSSYPEIGNPYLILLVTSQLSN